jgi:hypothetical protein
LIEVDTATLAFGGGKHRGERGVGPHVAPAGLDPLQHTTREHVFDYTEGVRQ